MIKYDVYYEVGRGQRELCSEDHTNKRAADRAAKGCDSNVKHWVVKTTTTEEIVTLVPGK